MKKIFLFLFLGMFMINFSLAYDVTYFVKNATIENNNLFNTTNQRVSEFSTEGYVCLDLGCSHLGAKVNGLNKTASSNFVVLNFPTGLLSSYGYAIYFYKEGYIGWEQKGITYYGTGSNSSTAYLSKQRTGQSILSASINTSARPNQNIQLVVLVKSPINDTRQTNVSLKENATVNVTLEVFNGSTKINSSSQNVTLDYSSNKTVNFTYSFPSVGNYTVNVSSEVIDAKVLNSIKDTISAKVTVADSVVPPTCTSFNYSVWSTCINGLQTRTVLTDIPPGCNYGTPVLSQTCTVTPTSSNLSGVKITSPNITTIYNSTILPLNYSINGNATLCNYSLNGQNFNLTNCSSDLILASNGINNLTVFVSNGTVSFNYTVSFTVNLSSSNDKISPNITVYSPKFVNNQTNNITINFSSDELVTCSYILNNGVNKTFLSPNTFFVSYENLSNGNYSLNIFCVDGSANNTTKNVSFIVNVTNGGNDDDDEDNDDDNDDSPKTSGTGYVLLQGGNETLDYLVLNEKPRETSPWAFFLVFLLLCVLVLFFIVLVLLIRDRDVKK